MLRNADKPAERQPNIQEKHKPSPVLYQGISDSPGFSHFEILSCSCQQSPWGGGWCFACAPSAVARESPGSTDMQNCCASPV